MAVYVVNITTKFQNHVVVYSSVMADFEHCESFAAK